MTDSPFYPLPLMAPAVPKSVTSALLPLMNSDGYLTDTGKTATAFVQGAWLAFHLASTITYNGLPRRGCLSMAVDEQREHAYGNAAPGTPI